MSNETTTGAPLAATLGERLEEKVHEGAASETERAVLETSGAAGPGRADEPARGDEPAAGAGTLQPGPSRAASPRSRSRMGWGIAAGVGALAAAGMVRRLFRR